MADPFSIAAGTIGVADVLFKVGSAIHRVQTGSSTIDEDIEILQRDVEALTFTNSAIQDLWERNKTRLPGSSLAQSDNIDDLWQKVVTILVDCKATAKQLEALVNDIAGETDPSKRPGKLQALKKTLRKETKLPGLREKRSRITDCQNSLQMLLSALILSYNQNSQDSTNLAIGHLSHTVQELSTTLKADIASFKSRLPAADGDLAKTFSDAVSSATAVAKLVSINHHFYIPKPVSSIFTGRSSLLDELRKAFDVSRESKPPSTTQKRFVVFGTGGSGKTELCCKFAQDHQDDFWGVFWIDATDSQTVEHSFSRIVKIAGIASSEGSHQRAAKEWLSRQERPWLLLVDNADDPNLPLQDCFPEGKRGCILVTTRVRAHKIHGTAGSKSYAFGPLPPDEANDLLLKAADKPSPWDPETTKHAISIASKLGCLPLALIQAGTAIRTGLCSLANYVGYLSRSWAELRRKRFNPHSRQEVADRVDSMVDQLLIYSSYELNLGHLENSKEQSHQDAVQLLKMFSCFHFQNIRLGVLIKAATNPAFERKLLQQGLEEENRFKAVLKPKTRSEYLRDKLISSLEFLLRDRSPSVLPSALKVNEPPPVSVDDIESRLRKALRHLADMSLINLHENGFTHLSMHPLWHTWVRQRPEMRLVEEALWCQAARTTLAQSIILPPHGSSEEEEAMRRSLLPHINHVRRCQSDIDARIKENKESRPRSWSQFLSISLTKAFAPKHTMQPREALELAKFSRVYMECTQWDEAEKLQVKVKEFACAKLGPDHPRTIAVSLFLAATYGAQTRANEAAELQEHALQAYTNSLGPNHPKTHKMKDMLGATRCFQGRFRDSRMLHEQAAEAMTNNFYGNSEEGLDAIEQSIEDLDRVSHSKFDEILEVHGDSIKRMRGASVTDPEDLFTSWANLGRIKWRYFLYDDSRRLYKKAALGLLALLGPSDSRTIDVLQDLALSYVDSEGEPSGGGLEHIDDALAIQKNIYDERKKTLGEESPLTLLALGIMARLESARGNHEEAERMFRNILPIAQRTLGDNHFGTLAGRAHFAQVLVRQTKYDEAEKLLQQVVQKRKYRSQARDDGNHPDHIIALWYLVRCYERHGKISEAIAHARDLEQAVETIGGEGLGKQHPFAVKLRQLQLQETLI
ncbi:TPR-like protein [Polyplosphaeria fusca]|uniref:TPR-like protein n=1 Tax=Polyplosphaeria fusca TaxID=682080 RepID=A0A9P4QML7_9PLEO|nr:TPR-like protein [Polyplosphaeria fusca]